ncbi:hypothetical protein CCACVL1_04623 [Corchorus capsularis]|uniref:Exonuclease 1 n=1 Tax=Corchorus capsularis TaxID=210143 RepID=A0A1R3JQX0_COCAP|nr:hypothetical protein CCACVL1_04623 [Corchorus capsularis]
MGFSLYSFSFVHPQLQHLVAKMTLLDTLLFYVVHLVDKFGVWHRLPVLLGLAYMGIRRHLHQRYNLLQVGGTSGQNYDTKELCFRTADGKCNHPSDDLVGSQGTFFGRNMPPSTSKYGLLDPHPSVVATKLLARKKLIDTGEQFNMIACSWIQFMIHDWIDHLEDTQQVELRAPDEIASGCPLKAFKFFKTKRVSTGQPEDINFGFLNSRTPWWDGSVIYGNNDEGMRRVRAFKDGKMKIAGDDLLQHDEKGIPISGDVRNCWAGFSLLQALFVKEHNAVCDMLKEHYPDLDDEKLFRYARLVTSAVIAKIHTIDWTVELLKTDTLLAGMRLTEEFSSVYKMHSLLPDNFILRDIKSTNSEYECPPIAEEVPMMELAGKQGERRLSKIGMEQMLVSMGHQACGAVTLWNYPSWMRNLVPHDINGEEVPHPIDMAALEIYRDRERGVARYNEFRRNLLMIPISKWEDLTDDYEVIEALSEVYGEDVEKLDLLVGLHAEKKIKGFTISETAFFIFLLIASRRLEADRFFTTNFNSQTYTEKGLEWVNKTESLKDVGIDAYSWLHKGAYSCSMEICLNSKSEKKTRYLDYFMHRINLLRFHKIIPVVVFDGANIPCKAATENERHRRRKDNRELAMAKLKEGDVKGAIELFQRAVSITPAMAHQLIQILRSENIEFVVAPYEADAQLAYLSTLEAEKGGVVAVITEDSDLLAYGCPATIFKMDRYGNGEELVLSNIFDSVTSKPSFRNFDKELFTGMCVLAGCDFLPSVPGIGIVKAHSLVSKYRNLDRSQGLPPDNEQNGNISYLKDLHAVLLTLKLACHLHVVEIIVWLFLFPAASGIGFAVDDNYSIALSVLKIEKGSQMPEDYSKSFKEAVAVFQHAIIYDAEIKGLRHMKPLAEQLLQALDEGLDFLGPKGRKKVRKTEIIGEIPPSVAVAIAEGNLDPINMEAFNCMPTSRNHLQPTAFETSARLQSLQTADISSQESCFMVFSSHKTREKSTMKQGTVSTERKYFPDAGLEKLAFPVKSHSAKENVVLEDITLKVPNNNPFKRRKVDEMHITKANDMTELVSLKGEDENSEILCVFPDNSQLTSPENISMSERKLEMSKQIESIAEEISVVTEVQNSETLCINMGSQESVSSKPKGVFSGRGRGKSEMLKRSKTLNTEPKNSILNFFARA